MSDWASRASAAISAGYRPEEPIVIKSTRELHPKAPKAKAPKKRNPQDATLRNVRAAKKDARALRIQVQDLEARLVKLAARVYRLERAPHAHRNHD